MTSKDLSTEIIVKAFIYTSEGLYWVSDVETLKSLFGKGFHAKNRAGKKACHLNYNGYSVLSIKGKYYYEHRLVWTYFYGRVPELIDHINQVRSDNRISNLREADKSVNGHNRGRPSSNTSGHKGVSWNKLRNKWDVRIQVNNKQHWIGNFDTLELAIKARKEAEEKYVQSV